MFHHNYFSVNSFDISMYDPYHEKSHVAQPLIPSHQRVGPKHPEYSLADRRRNSFTYFPTENMTISGELLGFAPTFAIISDLFSLCNHCGHQILIPCYKSEAIYANI